MTESIEVGLGDESKIGSMTGSYDGVSRFGSVAGSVLGAIGFDVVGYRNIFLVLAIIGYCACPLGAISRWLLYKRKRDRSQGLAALPTEEEPDVHNEQSDAEEGEQHAPEDQVSQEMKELVALGPNRPEPNDAHDLSDEHNKDGDDITTSTMVIQCEDQQPTIGDDVTEPFIEEDGGHQVKQPPPPPPNSWWFKRWTGHMISVMTSSEAKRLGGLMLCGFVCGCGVNGLIMSTLGLVMKERIGSSFAFGSLVLGIATINGFMLASRWLAEV